MEYMHEMIKFDAQLPVKIFTFKSINPNKIIPKHWHLSSELLFCVSGSLIVWKGSKKYVLYPNDIILINPNEIHSTQSPDDNYILVIQFPLSFLQKISDGSFYKSLVFNLNTPDCKDKSNHLVVVLKGLVEVCDKKESIVNNLHLRSGIYELLARIFEYYTEKPTSDNKIESTDLVLLGNITGYIQENYKERLTLSDISEKFGYSSSYFSKLFSNKMNLTFSEYLQQLRLNEANNQLLNSDDSLIDIALYSGFSTYRNFYNAFCINYKMSPQKYRNLYQQDKILHVVPKKTASNS